MRYIALFLALSPSLFADDASKTAKVDELLRVMKVESLVQQLYDQLGKQVDSMAASLARQYKLPPDSQPLMAEMSKRLMAIVSDQMSWEKMEPMYVKLYAEVFDENEIDGLLGFYRSPTGQAFVTKSPIILRKSNEMMQARLPEITAAIRSAMQDFVQQHHLQKP